MGSGWGACGTDDGIVRMGRGLVGVLASSMAMVASLFSRELKTAGSVSATSARDFLGLEECGQCFVSDAK